MFEINSIFEKKTELLCNGLFLDENLVELYLKQGIEIGFGRKGGAGPSGGRYFLFKDNTLVNVALWDNSKRTPLVLGEQKGRYFQIINSKSNEVFADLRLVPNPDYYDPSYITTDGIPMKKIALVHGIDCLSSTIYQKCVYWACGEACKFCGVELSLQTDSTILEKNAEQMNEVIATAKKENRCSHMTLTSGTDFTPDKGVNRYADMLRGIKKENPDLPLHVQIEPLEDLTKIDQLKDAGADTIGIHIEILDEKIRSKMTPGKAHIPYQSFEENWIHAIEVFGKNQVETFILTGLGESPNELIKDLEKIISIGVIPFITPVRSIPGKTMFPKMEVSNLIQIYRETAIMMKRFGVDPLKHKAGCVKCGGCSAITEAYKTT